MKTRLRFVTVLFMPNTTATVHPLSTFFAPVKLYGLEFYQRDYEWTSHHFSELISDLANTFHTSYTNLGKDYVVGKAAYYHLGSFQTSTNEENPSITNIVDGYQRFTSLMLLFIHLREHLSSLNNAASDDKMILDAQGQLTGMLLSFNEENEQTVLLQVPGRTEFLESLLTGVIKQSNNPSIQNMSNRYAEVGGIISSIIQDKEELCKFVRWLGANVEVIEIQTEDANTTFSVFENNNDRGMIVSHVDLAKGYLIHEAEAAKRDECAVSWQNSIGSINSNTSTVADKNIEQELFLTALLRSQYAQTIKPGTSAQFDNKDWENIGEMPHRWIKNNLEKLPLSTPGDVTKFIKETIPFYTKAYSFIKHAESKFDADLYRVFSVAHVFNDLRYPLYLAALDINDTQADIKDKVDIISRYLQTRLMRRAISHNNVTQKWDIPRHFFPLIQKMRGVTVSELAAIVKFQLAKEESLEEGFECISRYRHTPKSPRLTKWILGNLNAEVSRELGDINPLGGFLYQKNTSDPQQKPFQVEHLMADKFEDLGELYDIDDKDIYGDIRNSLGALTLVNDWENQLLGVSAYEDKLPLYKGTLPILTKVLAMKIEDLQNTKTKIPLLSYCTDTNINLFVPEQNMNMNLIKKRNDLYMQLSERYWNTTIVDDFLDITLSGQIAYPITEDFTAPIEIVDLLKEKLLLPGDKLEATIKGQIVEAILLPSGNVTCDLQQHTHEGTLNNISTQIRGNSGGTWTMWKKMDGSNRIRLDKLRDDLKLERIKKSKKINPPADLTELVNYSKQQSVQGNAGIVDHINKLI